MDVMRAPAEYAVDVAAGNRIQQGKIVVKGSTATASLAPAAVPAGHRNAAILTSSLEPVPRFAVNQRSRGRQPEDWAMTILKWALIFFLVSIVAGLLGFTGVSAATADVARFLFYVFVVIFLVLLILGLTIFRV
jgi:uncharacterized membrane protein YtjA (UPF0391 family)